MTKEAVETHTHTHEKNEHQNQNQQKNPPNPRDAKFYMKIPEVLSAKICQKEGFLDRARENHSSTRQLYWTLF